MRNLGGQDDRCNVSGSKSIAALEFRQPETYQESGSVPKSNNRFTMETTGVGRPANVLPSDHACRQREDDTFEVRD